MFSAKSGECSLRQNVESQPADLSFRGIFYDSPFLGEMEDFREVRRRKDSDASSARTSATATASKAEDEKKIASAAKALGISPDKVALPSSKLPFSVQKPMPKKYRKIIPKGS